MIATVGMRSILSIPLFISSFLFILSLFSYSCNTIPGSTAKVEIAKKAGAHHVIDLSKENLVTSVKRITGDKGADVVYLYL